MSSLLLTSLRRCCSATGIPSAFLRASSTNSNSNNTRYPRPESHRPAGTEEWNFKLPVSGSGGNTYMWPANNLRVHPPLDEMPGESEAARAVEAGEKTPEEARCVCSSALRTNSICNLAFWTEFQSQQQCF